MMILIQRFLNLQQKARIRMSSQEQRDRERENERIKMKLWLQGSRGQKTERTKASVVMQKNIKESDSQDNIEVTSNIEEILHYQEVDSISRFRS